MPRLLLTLTILFLPIADATAQFLVPVPYAPVLVPSGIGFHYHGRRLSVSGYFNTGYSVGIAPGFGYYPVPLSGYVTTQVGVTVIQPTIVLPPRTLGFYPDEVDLSGVDLDREPPPLPPGEPRPAPRHKIEPPAETKQEARPKEVPPPQVKPSVKEEPEPRNAFERSQRLLDQGLKAFTAGEYGLAAVRFRQATGEEPTAGRAYFLLAQTHVAQSKFRDAVLTIEEGLRHQPTWPMSPFQPRADLYAAMEAEYDRQLKLLDDLVTRHPADGGYAFLQGYLAWFDGRRDAARKILAAARPLVADPTAIDRFLKADVAKK